MHDEKGRRQNQGQNISNNLHTLKTYHLLTVDKTKIYYRFCDPIVDIYVVFSCYYDVSSQKLN